MNPRDAEAAKLRARRWTYQRIANELGYADPSNARRAVQRALRESVREANDVAVTLDLKELEDMASAAWEVLERNHITISQGRVVTLDGVPVPDDGPILAAIATLLRIQERRAKLLGMDAPTASKVEVVTESVVDAAIAQLEAELHERATAES